ncbi:MAG: hypothetical protein VCD00_09225 [Candidatus Hydrogenedentota bacterium]
MWVTITILAIVRVLLLFNPQPLYPLARDGREMYIQLPEFNHQRATAALPEGESIHPRLLFLGSSRQFQLPARRISSALGLARGEGKSYAAPASTYFSMYQLVKRNPEIASNCEVLVIDILPSQMNMPLEDSELTPIFIQQATFAEKFRLSRWSDRLLVVADNMFPFYSTRYSPLQWQIGLSSDGAAIEQYNTNLLNAAVARSLAEMEEYTEAQRINTVLSREFPPFHHLDVQRQSFLDLLGLFPETATILLVRPPYRDDADQLIRDDPLRAESMHEFRKFIESIDHKNVEVIWIEKASDLGMTYDDYNDDGAHFSNSGLVKLKDFYVNTIRERELLKPN